LPSLPAPRDSERPDGFSLLEILVAIAIMAVMAAVVYPAVSSKLRDSRTAVAAQTLLGLSQAIAEEKRATTMYPGNLQLLTTVPSAGSSYNICGALASTNVYSSTQAGLWRGPYISRDILSTGVVIGDATINAGLRRVVSGSSTWLVMDVPAVEQKIAEDLDTQFDGGGASSSTTGTIQWSTSSITGTTTSSAVSSTASPLTNLSYYMPINSC
jgi:type IV pilus assembly protein PilE